MTAWPDTDGPSSILRWWEYAHGPAAGEDMAGRCCLIDMHISRDASRWRAIEISGGGTYPSDKRISERPIAVVVSGLAALSVLLYGLLDSRAGSGEVLGIHRPG